MAREAHFKQLFTSLKNKPAKFWRLINDICGRSTKKAVIPDRLSLERVELSHPQTVVDALNEHFASVGRKTTSTLGDRLPILLLLSGTLAAVHFRCALLSRTKCIML